MSLCFHRKTIVALLALFCASLLTVAYLTNIYTPLSDDLTERELIGDWSPVPESVSFLRETNMLEGEVTKLILRDDRSFELSNMPDCWISKSVCKGSTNNFKGVWTLYRRSGTNDWWLELTERTPSEIRTHAVPLIGRHGRTEICFSLADPDEGKEIYLDKQ
jgi:hypothetical protein